MPENTPSFIPVKTQQQIDETARLADIIWHDCYAELLKPEQIDYMVEKFQSARAIAAQMEQEGYEYFLVYVGQAPAGYIGIQAKDDRLLLSKLYMLAEYRGRGLARPAMEFVEQAGRQRQCLGVWLTVNRHNHRAIAAYRKTGYELTREQVADIGGGYVMDDYIFEKSF